MLRKVSVDTASADQILPSQCLKGNSDRIPQAEFIKRALSAATGMLYLVDGRLLLLSPYHPNARFSNVAQFSLIYAS